MLEQAPTIPQIWKQKTLACSSSWLYLDTWNALDFLTSNTSCNEHNWPPLELVGWHVDGWIMLLIMSIVICYYYCSSNLVTCITRTPSGNVECLQKNAKSTRHVVFWCFVGYCHTTNNDGLFLGLPFYSYLSWLRYHPQNSTWYSMI